MTVAEKMIGCVDVNSIVNAAMLCSNSSWYHTQIMDVFFLLRSSKVAKIMQVLYFYFILCVFI